MNTKGLLPDKSRLKILVYGGFGTCKTLFAGSFPNPYFLDLDEGILTLAGKDVEYDQFSQETLSAVSSLKAKIEELLVKCPFETVVLDSLTFLTDLFQRYITRISGKTQFDRPEWNLLKIEVKNIVDKFLLIPAKNRIVIAHEDIKKDEVVGSLKIVPLVTGKLSALIPTRFDLVLHSEAIQGKDQKSTIVLRAEAAPMVGARTRVKFKTGFCKPDYNSLMEEIA